MKADFPEFRFSAKAGRTTTQPISSLVDLAVRDKNVISLAAGLVDEGTLPADRVRLMAGELLGEASAGQKALQYGTTAGLAELRKTILEYVCELDGVRPEDIALTPDNVIIGSGSQQLLYIITDILVDPGDIVITEWPSYFVYTGVLISLGASVRTVEMDAEGMSIESLKSTLEDLKRSGDLQRVKIVYLCDYYQNPTGITLTPNRREELLQVVRSYSNDHRICILEDAAYRELSCEDAAPRSIKSYEPDNAQVVLAQTFSKSFSPGLKTGYAIAPDDLAKAVLDQKACHDFGSCNFTQHLLLRAMQSGAYAEQVELLRRRYRTKRDAILAALRENLGDFEPGRTRWTTPGGGLYVYLTLPERIDTGPAGKLFEAALAEGVVYVPGEYCYGPDPRRRPERNHMRLTFATVDEPAIREGIARLSRAIRGLTDGSYRPINADFARKVEQA